MTKLGVLCHPKIPAARVLAAEVSRAAGTDGHVVWMASPWDELTISQEISSTDLIICLGGDGTVLSAARSVVPRPVPILSVKMGKLGFLSELAPDDLLGRLPELLSGHYRLERRMMLAASLPVESSGDGAGLHALNDVVVSRATVGRPVVLTLFVDGVRLLAIRADALIVATPTGSTGYNLSAGGPILHPEAADIVVTAVAPHLSVAYPLVLPADSDLTVVVESEHEALVSLDGQVNRPLATGSAVRIRRSAYSAHLIRFGRPAYFYHRLSPYLDMIPLE